MEGSNEENEKFSQSDRRVCSIRLFNIKERDGRNRNRNKTNFLVRIRFNQNRWSTNSKRFEEEERVSFIFK